MSGFTVIDNKTNKEPDCEKIALTEEWAKHLIYCDIDSFAITEDGSLILLDDCGNCAFCPADRFTVVFEKADVVPKSEVEEWVDKCRERHKVAELKSQCIMVLDEGLAKANAEVARLHSILLQFTEIVHKWGAKNNIDTSEISLVPILQKEADGIVGKMEQEIETLKDNNEHLAVLLEEAKDEANRYKRYYFHHDYDKMIAEAKAEVAREFIEAVDSMLELVCAMTGLELTFFGKYAELKKKYTEENNNDKD